MSDVEKSAQGHVGVAHDHQPGPTHGKDGHVHLNVVRPKAAAAPPWDWARWLVVALAASSAALFVRSPNSRSNIAYGLSSGVMG